MSLTWGIQTIFLESSFQLWLTNNLIFADYAIHLKLDYHQYKLDWDTQIFAIPRDYTFIEEIKSLSSAW